MRIEVKGRNLPVNEELREHVEKRFQKIAKQVSDLAVLEVEISKERNPANPEKHGGRGDPLPEGRHAARQGRLAQRSTTR